MCPVPSPMASLLVEYRFACCVCLMVRQVVEFAAKVGDPSRETVAVQLVARLFSGDRPCASVSVMLLRMPNVVLFVQA